MHSPATYDKPSPDSTHSPKEQLQLSASPPCSPRGLCVPEMVELQACRNPHRIALVGNGIELSYGELNARANQIAHHLRHIGVGPEDRVALCLSRSPLNVVGALGVLKAGAAYLPLDPTYPRERLSFILSDAQTPVLLMETSVADEAPEGSWKIVLLDRDAQLISGYSSDAPPISVAQENLAYVIYTSGSTGTPKGVEVTHESLVNLVLWHQKAFAVTAEDRVTQLASFGFDAAVWEIWPNLRAGATVHITPEVIRSSPEMLRDWLVAREITVSFVPTALAERLMVLDWPADTKLRTLLTGADTLHHYPRPNLPFSLINNYGPTEATVVTTSAPVPPALQPPVLRPSIGRPIDNVEVYLCDDSLNPVASGEVGEIVIGGAGIARGYVNNPEMTRQKFLPDSFSKKPGARLYRTGDLARQLPDGQLSYVGRSDDLIKIRGYRVEPNEIVSVLNGHPAIEASAVIADEDGIGNKRLLAYVVLDEHTPVSAGELRSLAREMLPDYMVPAHFIRLDAMPSTPNGKLDRDALPPLSEANVLEEAQLAEPQNALEAKVCALIAGLLGLERVGMEDNFFVIGGHSLLGAQLIARVRDSFGVELSLRSIFDSPTPAQLADEIEGLLVAALDSMSEDDVRRALRQPASPGGSYE